jgi:prevent-host-death family protein
MRVTGVFEAKQHFSELVAAVEAGEEVRITRHGKEVVRMLPVSQGGHADEQLAAEALAKNALANLRRFRNQVKPGPGWRELRDEGRRV